MNLSRSTASVLALAALSLGCTDQTMEASRFTGPMDVPVFSHSAADAHFRANPLKGDNEIPANDSKGNGVAQFQLSEDGASLDYKLVVANLTGVTQSHIHIGSRTQNGPVVVFLYGFNAAGTSENGLLAEGTITAANLIPRASTPIGPFNATMAELVAAIRSGNAYVNVHTLGIPPGEIRNQVETTGH